MFVCLLIVSEQLAAVLIAYCMISTAGSCIGVNIFTLSFTFKMCTAVLTYLYAKDSIKTLSTATVKHFQVQKINNKCCMQGH